MDAHFKEYLAAIAGMALVYGERSDDQPSEFHAEAPEQTVAVSAG